jgi:hypothetical protein
MVTQLRSLALLPLRTGLGLARLPFRLARGLLPGRGGGRDRASVTPMPRAATAPPRPQPRREDVPLVDESGPTAPRARAKAALRDAPPAAKPVNGPTPGQAARLRETQREREGDPDGPGPTIHVDPPWEGYDGMTASQIIERLQTADAAEAAVVALYEASHRDRATVVRAASSRR